MGTPETKYRDSDNDRSAGAVVAMDDVGKDTFSRALDQSFILDAAYLAECVHGAPLKDYIREAPLQVLRSRYSQRDPCIVALSHAANAHQLKVVVPSLSFKA